MVCVCTKTHRVMYNALTYHTRKEAKSFMNKKVNILFLVWITLIVSPDSWGHERSKSEIPRKHGHWTAPPEASKRVSPIPSDDKSINRGKRLFQTHCSICHGPQGKATGPAAARLNTKPPNLVKMAGHHTDGDIAWKIENGRGSMPAWKDRLKEIEIWDLTNFIQTLSSELPSR